MLPMTLKQLEIFVAVAEHNGFRRASERLNLSQSAVTAHIKLLEAHLGVPLFHRTTRSIRMTDAGENLYRRTGRILDGLEDIVRTFHDEASMSRGRVLLTSAPSFAATRLPQILARFREHNPNITVHVREAYANDMLDTLRRGDADFAIGPMENLPREFESTQFLADGYSAVVARNHALAGRNDIPLDALTDETILALPLPSRTRTQVESAFQSLGMNLVPHFEMLHHQTLISLAEQGLGVAILPETAVPPSKDGAYWAARIKHPGLTRKIGIITLRGQTLAPGANELVKLIAGD
ncbi:MAG: LysR family transcriptional regulator [Rhodospirillales bacterium]